MVVNYFGVNLRRIRREKGISENDLAQMLAISKSIISRWENGKVYPQVIWVYQIADKLNVNPTELIKVT